MEALSTPEVSLERLIPFSRLFGSVETSGKVRCGKVRGLVCHDRSKRRILPHLHPSSSQEVPEVRFRGQSLPYVSLRSALHSHPTLSRMCGWVKWSDVWPSMVTHTWNLCSAFNPSKCTHTVVNTHTLWTHTRSSGQPMLQRPGSNWGFSALLKGLTSVVVLKVERALVFHSSHRQFLPDLRLEPATLQVRLSIH